MFDSKTCAVECEGDSGKPLYFLLKECVLFISSYAISWLNSTNVFPELTFL